MVVPSPITFQGGQMTDLPSFEDASFDGTELFEVVAPGNDEEGVNYSVTSALLAVLLAELLVSATIITDGEYSTPGDPYTPPSSTGRIYINKSTPEPTYIQFDAASEYLVEPLVKDVAGTVDTGSEVTVTFSGGEEADGNATVQIVSPYGGYFFRPIGDLGLWTLGSA